LIVKHTPEIFIHAGDFLTSDGEKPDRSRDTELK
jgi:hypothetical protein